MGCKFKKTAHALFQIFWGPWNRDVIAVVWVTKGLHFYIYLRVILKEPETVDEKKKFDSDSARRQCQYNHVVSCLSFL